MLKYIVKRLGISIIILLGVSVIVYTLVRMMPNDYVDTKYASQLQNGTIKREDVTNFKKLYGLYNPKAELSITLDGTTFSYGKTEARKDDDMETDGLYLAFIIDASGSSDNGEITYTNGNDSLILRSQDGGETRTFRLIRPEFNTDEETGETYKTDIVTMSGTFSVHSATETIVFHPEKAADIETSLGYREYSFFERLGTILRGYFSWLGNLCKGDLGTSFSNEKPVAQVISENMWISFAIAVVATILQFAIAIPLGISSATHQYTVRDYLVTIFTMIGLSLPTYFFAAIMIKVLSVDTGGWLPSSGLLDPGTYPATFAGAMKKLGNMAKHLVLPIFVSVVLSLGGLMRYTRTNTLEVLNSDYIRTARAKGLSEKTVIYKHAFRNTLIPLATLLAGILPSLFGGMMITEEVFAIDGIGRLAYKALKGGDLPFVMGYNMFLAILTVIGTLLSDIMYSIVDPRVKLGK